MPQLQPKQIQKVIAAPIKIVGLTVTAGVSQMAVSSPITSALLIASNAGGSVPNQVSADVFTPGVVVSTPTNRSEIFLTTSKEKIATNTGEEVYGRMTYSGGVFTLLFFNLDTSGVENAYVFASQTIIDFDFVYRYSFDSLPSDSLVSFVTRNVSQDPKGVGAQTLIEKLVVTSINTLSAMANIPSNTSLTKLNVNGQVHYAIGTSPSFAVSGTNIIWSSSNAGFPLEITDAVFVEYKL